jgi:hypothetical protein
MPTIIPVVSVSDDLPLSGGETVPTINISVGGIVMLVIVVSVVVGCLLQR